MAITDLKHDLILGLFEIQAHPIGPGGHRGTVNLKVPMKKLLVRLDTDVSVILRPAR